MKRATKPPTFTRAVSIDGMENNTAAIVLSDHDQYFTGKLKSNDRYVKGKTVQIKTKDHTLFTGAVSKFPAVENNRFTIKADTFSLLDVPGNESITTDEPQFGNIPGSSLGRPGNVILGNADFDNRMFTASRVDTAAHLACWHPLSEITAAQDKNGNDILSSITMQVDPVSNYTYILSALTDDVIYFSAKGPTSGGQLIENPAEMLDYYLQRFGNLSIENLSEATTIFNNRGYTGILFATKALTIKDMLRDFQESFSCKIVFTKEGNLKIKTIQWGDLGTATPIETSAIKDFKKRREMGYLKQCWKRKYQFSANSGKYLLTPMDVKSRSQWTTKTGEFKQKFITLDTVSWDSALRESFMRNDPYLIITFQIPVSVATGLELGDEILLSHRDY
ncbi:MAG: hypothetical protein GY940_47315, partial [bacterium]|nr:hypothetical protein [bacterium]